MRRRGGRFALVIKRAGEAGLGSVRWAVGRTGSWFPRCARGFQVETAKQHTVWSATRVGGLQLALIDSSRRFPEATRDLGVGVGCRLVGWYSHSSPRGARYDSGR
jgi:hypothetical protein